MKFNLALIALVHAGDDTRDDDQWYGPASNGTLARSGGRNSSDNGEGRYDDLEAIANKYWRSQGLTGVDKFNERKYWAYGCLCFILGTSEMGKGKPVDGLDNKCKAYKDCLKCVREKNGDTCSGDSPYYVRYTWRFATNLDAFISRDPAGSCERELFECDLQFVKDTFAQKKLFSNDYHHWWSDTGFDRKDESSCPSGASTPVEHECCGGDTKPYFWIGLNKSKCCDGKVVGVNDQC